MRTGNKKRGPSPILKFTLIIVLLFAVGFFIFYSIDNPYFLKSKFPSIFSRENGDDVSEDTVSVTAPYDNSDTEDTYETGGDDAGVTLDTTGGVASGDTESDIGSGDDVINEGNYTDPNPSLWQKIRDFLEGITGRGDGEEHNLDYPSSMEINIYFAGTGEENKLVAEKRTINAGSPDIAVQNAVQELLKGPAKSYYFPVIPAGTELNSAETSDNVVKIDLSQEFLEESLDTRILDEYIIYSIVNTLTEIQGIEGVVFYIEGVRIKVYGDLDLSIPAIRNKELLGGES
jgi:hypothetical protein